MIHTTSFYLAISTTAPERRRSSIASMALVLLEQTPSLAGSESHICLALFMVIPANRTIILETSCLLVAIFVKTKTTP